LGKTQHDTGPGMTKTELGKLFRRFSQANSDVHCQMGGSGLGLFIAKQLCELQGGRIEAISSPNEGATFRFFIQAATVKQPDTNIMLSRPSSVPPKLPSMAMPVIVPPLHILVCDDNIVNRKTLARQLKQHKHKVVMAEDGQEALVRMMLLPSRTQLINGTVPERHFRLRESWNTF
jgi:CheY-like chemotaxis protein